MERAEMAKTKELKEPMFYMVVMTNGPNHSAVDELMEPFMAPDIHTSEEDALEGIRKDGQKHGGSYVLCEVVPKKRFTYPDAREED
jgi:hypothetical protein